MKTTDRQRRRKMALGLFAAGVALIGTVGLATVGSLVLGNSQLGTEIDGGGIEGPVRRLPESYTALIGVTNNSGRITSVAALALHPSGVGGAIMPMSASADVGAGQISGVLRPLSASVAQQGADSFRKDAESISNIQFDMAELVDAERFQQLFGSLGALDVTLTTPVMDTETGTDWQPGDYSFEVAEAAQVMTATNNYVQDWYHDPARYGVWRAIALGGTAADGPPAVVDAAPQNMDEFVERLLAGPVQERGLGIVGVDEARVVEELDPELKAIYGTGGVPSVVIHKTSEAVVVGSAVAPGRLGAPVDGARYRVVVSFDENDLAGRDFNLAQAGLEAVDRLLFSKVNVPSVVLLNAPAQPTTVVEVARAEDLEAAKATAEKLFGGSVEARVATEPIVGIDVQIFLGKPYLETVEGPLTDFVGPNTMELNSSQPLTDSPAPTTTTIAPQPNSGDSTDSTDDTSGDSTGDTSGDSTGDTSDDSTTVSTRAGGWVDVTESTSSPDSSGGSSTSPSVSTTTTTLGTTDTGT